MSNALAQISAVAVTIMALLVSVLAVVAIPALLGFRKMYGKVERLVDRLQTDLKPITEKAYAISDDVSHVTTAIRQDIDKVNATIDRVNGTIESANDRVHEALTMTEDRVREFHALLAVAQEEAEQLFVSGASTVRGLQHGAAAFRDRSGMDLASDESDEANLADDLAIQEERDGDDSNPDRDAEAPRAPRVRPRASNRRRA